MIISIYGNMSRLHNEHLFLVCTRSIMLEELVSNSYTGDISTVASNFMSGDSVFGELVRSYFSLTQTLRMLRTRCNELQMVAKQTPTNSILSTILQVYYEIRKAQGKASVTDKDILSFNDAQREDSTIACPV